MSPPTSQYKLDELGDVDLMSTPGAANRESPNGTLRIRQSTTNNPHDMPRELHEKRA